MNIKDFEKEIDSKILACGKDYFSKGLIGNLEEEGNSTILRKLLAETLKVTAASHRFYIC